MEIFDVQEALIKLSNSPPPNRFQPIRTQAAIVKSSLGRSALTSSSSALPTVSSTPNASTTSSSSSTSSSTIAASLPSSKVSTQLRETIKLVQRFADKMVSKISNVNNLDQELAERSREMANVVSHLEACLALSSPPAKPYTLEEIEAVSQRISSNSSNQKGLNCSSDSVDSPRLSSVALRSSANQIHNNNSSCSDNESTDGDYDLDEGDSDTENLDAFQPLAYYVGVIKAHLELRKPDASRKSSGLKRDVLKKEYVLVPIEEASRVLGISTTKLSRAYKSTSILSRCGWVFKGRKRRLRWPTRPLRVLLKYICEKYLCEMANSYVSLEADKQQQQQRLPRSHSLDHLLI